MAGAEEGGEHLSGLFVHPTLTVRPNQAFQVRILGALSPISLGFPVSFFFFFLEGFGDGQWLKGFVVQVCLINRV